MSLDLIENQVMIAYSNIIKELHFWIKERNLEINKEMVQNICVLLLKCDT